MSILNVIIIHNPLQPGDCSKEQLEFRPGMSMAELFPFRAGEAHMSYTLNGEVIDDDKMALVKPGVGDWITRCPIPAGGEGGKSILRIIAMIAISTFAPAIASTLYGALGGTLVSAFAPTALSLLQVGVVVVGASVVNALLPPPKAPESSDSSSSASYGVDGAKNTSAEGLPTPVIYGKFRYGGNVINNYTVNDGDTQVIYMLINCGEGPIAGITDIMINDQPVSAYKDSAGKPTVEVKTLLGTGDQQPIDWFNDIITPHSINLKVLDGANWRTYSTSAPVDRLRLDFSGQLFKVEENGDYSSASVTIEIQYRTPGGTWLPLPGTTDVVGTQRVAVYNKVPVYNAWGEGIGESTYVPNGTESTVGDIIYDSNGYQVGSWVTSNVYQQNGQLVLKNASRTTHRRSFTSAPLTAANYEVRVRRTTVESTSDKLLDSIYITDVNEIVSDDVGYRGVAVLGVKARLSDQLNGLPTVTHLNGGKVISSFDESTPHVTSFKPNGGANPAWICYDILTNKRYGAGCPASRIDLMRFREWAKFCDDNGLEFNGVFDTQTNVWDALMVVSRCGRGMVYSVGTRYTVAIERAEDPVQMFSVANMVTGTFKETWLSMSDRANEVEFTFSDKADNYKQRTIRVADKLSIAAGQPQRTATVTMQGVDTVERAFYESHLILRMNRYIRRTIEFSAPMDAIACRVGSVILVQHDMPKWGAGGRLESGSTTTNLKLDRPVTMEVGKSYEALVHFDAVQRFTGTVTNKIGNSLFLSGFTGATNVKRLKVGTIDVGVDSVFANGVIVDDSTGISVGNTYTLWDTNVLEKRSVTLAVGEQTQVNLALPFASAPAQYSKWMFGEVDKSAKPFRVRSIGGSSEYRRDIVAIEYNDAIYDAITDPVPDINYSTLDPVAAGDVLPAEITQTYETLSRIGSMIQPRVTVVFKSAQAAYASSDVFVSRNGGSFLFEGAGQSEVTVSANDGDVLVFQVVAKDRFGRFAAVTTSASYTVIGKTAPPSTVTGFSGTVESFGIRLKWAAIPDVDADIYEIRYGATWDSGQLLDQVRGTDFFWKALASGSHTFWVKARDTSGNYSATATSTVVILAAPLAPTVTYRLAGGADEVLEWSIPASGIAIDRYEVRMGSTWAAGTFVNSVKGTALRQRVTYVGTRRYWVAAIDAGGNVGAAASIDVTISAPGPVISPYSEVIDNNVLFYWQKPADGSLEIDRYEVRRGATWASGVSIGSNGNSTFGTVFEQTGGTYTYWITAYDIAGNEGTPASLVATVAQPPDYVLRTSVNSTFAGTKINVIVESGTLLGPVNTSETWASHFTSRGWSTPQNQIDAGYPIYVQPTQLSATYAEAYDYFNGAPETPANKLAATTISVTLNTTLIAGSVNPTVQIYYKLNAADAWTAAPAGSSALVISFRYILVIVTLTASSNTGLMRINAMNIKLANKLKTDSGTFTIDNAATGVYVPFGVSFVDADTPIAQPNGTTSRIALVDFADVPNPAGATYYLIDLATGLKVTGSGSWAVRGY